VTGRLTATGRWQAQPDHCQAQPDRYQAQPDRYRAQPDRYRASTPDHGRGTLVIRQYAMMDPLGRATRWPLSSSLCLGALPTATPCARLHARAVLAEWGLGDAAEAAELAVSELVTNAVRASTDSDGQPRYGEGGLPVVNLRLSTDRARVLIEVWDDSPEAPVAGQADPDDENGRGLTLVEAVCDRWSWHTLPGWSGKVVWAELDVQSR